MSSADTRPDRLFDEQRQVNDLLMQVAWFNRLRLLAAASVIWLTALAAHALAVIVDPWPLYALGGLIALVDGVYILWFPRLRRGTPRRIRRHVDLQITVDLVILTALLHYAGGVTNPLALFYLFHVFLAALLLSARAAILFALMSVLLLLALGFGERLGWLDHRPLLHLGLLELHGIQPLGFWLLLLAFVSTLAFAIYFVTNLVLRIRRNESQLLRLGRQLALSEKLASVGTLAAGVSHEINNPVGVIRNTVQILRYRLQDGDPPEQLLLELETIDKHSRRIHRITDGLLAFSRETPFSLQPLHLNELAREAADLVRVPFQNAEVRLELDLAAADPQVRGSSNHLLQVLINILLNAKDASGRGTAVRLGTTCSPQEAEVVVQDHGQGIDERHLAKIFDPFFTTKDVDKGTGLGLAISHGIVERHRGRIEVDSELGAGSTFRVVLPRL